jgi:hypothetical protein
MDVNGRADPSLASVHRCEEYVFISDDKAR